MKIRLGFVSNSSSSSFTISMDDISVNQLKLLRKHDLSEEFLGDDWNRPSDAWQIDEKKGYIICSTFMDNFDLISYAESIGIREDAIER